MNYKVFPNFWLVLYALWVCANAANKLFSLCWKRSHVVHCPYLWFYSDIAWCNSIKMLCLNHICFLFFWKKYLVDCDDVIFMREGSITEKGSHEDLMNLNGDYAAMFNNLQLGDTPFIEVRPANSSQTCPNLP